MIQRNLRKNEKKLNNSSLFKNNFNVKEPSSLKAINFLKVLTQNILARITIQLAFYLFQREFGVIFDKKGMTNTKKKKNPKKPEKYLSSDRKSEKSLVIFIFFKIF